MFAGLVSLVVLVMKLFPELPLSRRLHAALVEEPLARLATVGRRHLIYAAVLVGMMFTGAEMVMLLGSADLMMLMAWDVSLYVDALIASWTLSAGLSCKAVVVRALDRVRGTARRRSPRRRRTAANDADDDGGDRAYALAA